MIQGFVGFAKMQEAARYVSFIVKSSSDPSTLLFDLCYWHSRSVGSQRGSRVSGASGCMWVSIHI